METYLIVSLAVNIVLVASDMASNQTSNLCLTPVCIHAASSVLNNMDTSVEPCDDFYQFACGNFIKHTIIPDDEFEVSFFHFTRDLVNQQLRVALEENVTAQEPQPFKLLKKIYQACINTTAIELDGLTTIKSILEELGGWPVVKGRKWDQQKFDWKESIYKFRKLGYNFNYFITVTIILNTTNSSRHMLYIGPADASRSNTSDLKCYLNKMVNIATNFGAKKSVAKRELNKLLKFELRLSMISKPFSGYDNYQMSVSELQQQVPNIPWLEYLNSVFNVPNITIEASDVIISVHPNYFLKLKKLLINTPKRTQANYLMWKVVESSIPYLTEKLQQDNYSTFRWKKCVSIASEKMPTATGALYVRKHFHEDARQNAMEIVSDIRKEFANMVKIADWMDDDTKQHALEKVAAMSSYIAYPDEFLSDEKLEDFYKELHVEFDNFLKIELSIQLFDYENAAKRLVLPFNQTDWVVYAKPVDINAYYYPRLNRMMLPAAILQDVFFNADRPRYMNYGAIGFIIAHEITHGFDNKGRERDKFGNLQDWWAPSTNANFITKAQCIIDQYGNHSVPELGLNINGSNTQGENIADNGGIRSAYIAYNEWIRRNEKEHLLPGLNYTDRQLFWISFANVFCEKQKPIAVKEQIHTDVHPPSKFRINIPLSNTDYFAKDFNCPIGSKMNPVKKCKVWKF